MGEHRTSGNDLLDRAGQIAVVTGAGQNVGRAIALLLARHNAGGIAANDFVAERTEAVAEIGTRRVPALAVPFDVARPYRRQRESLAGAPSSAARTALKQGCGQT